ncbi:MAG: alanyl-tRNA synthetase [Olpidium bornovanus]|uniref:alanine--tRNA ligase n=1 Tax=Olpidium bornovanus TaxID=278681 RepID=A0A8H7ZT96_9FUNG|nr:MAG: alanyl-tRNA synthetase [Olpidium bornovanus]
MAFARARGSQSRCTPARAWPAVPGRPRLATARPRLMSSAEIRSRFTDFFVAANYTKVESSALVPCKNDNSLLFTNAGELDYRRRKCTPRSAACRLKSGGARAVSLRQSFKEYFLNPDASPFQKAVSVQKCLRAGGKHNDLDNVGYTPRHHTFFEMLGNFQFAGGACKKDTIATSWKFLTNELNLPMDRLRVSIWRNHVGVPESRIVRRGETDNFWSMGNDGPCGPCTEVFWDTGLAVPDDERWLEIWNLVFVQFNRVGDQLRPLPALCVDTGMGLERLASVLQVSSVYFCNSDFRAREINKQSNFDIDTFSRLKADTLLLVDKFMLNVGTMVCFPAVFICRTLPTPNQPDRDNELFRPSLHIVADHFRAVCFLIAEGVVPR